PDTDAVWRWDHVGSLADVQTVGERCGGLDSLACERLRLSAGCEQQMPAGARQSQYRRAHDRWPFYHATDAPALASNARSEPWPPLPPAHLQSFTRSARSIERKGRSPQLSCCLGLRGVNSAGYSPTTRSHEHLEGTDSVSAWGSAPLTTPLRACIQALVLCSVVCLLLCTAGRARAQSTVSGPESAGTAVELRLPGPSTRPLKDAVEMHFEGDC